MLKNCFKILILLLSLNLYANQTDGIKYNYTIAVSYNISMENTNAFLESHPTSYNTYIFKYKNGYRITYEMFNSKEDAMDFQATLPTRLANSSFVLDSKDDLRYIDDIDNLIRFIPKKTIHKTIHKTIKKTAQKPKKVFDAYTLLIGGTNSSIGANKFIKEELSHSSYNTYILKSQKHYLLHYGLFKTKKEAKNAIKTLPQNIINYNPKITPTNKSLYEISVSNTNLINKIEPIKEPKQSDINQTIITKTKIIEKEIDINMGIDLRFHNISQDGKFKYGLDNPKIDFKQDLLQKEKKIIVIPRLFLSISKHLIYASFQQVNYKNTIILPKSIKLLNTNFEANKKTKIILDTSHISSGYRYNYYGDYLAGIDLHLFNQKNKISNQDNETAINTSSIFVSLGLDFKHIFNNIINIKYGGNLGINKDIKYSKIYFELEKDIPFIKGLSLGIGYEAQKFKIIDGMYDGDIKYNGGYFELKKVF